MKLLNLAVLACKQVVRAPLRSALTICGVASGMFLYTTVETMQQSMHEATEVQAGDTTLVVYRENRFCPFTSRLPQHYQNRIEALPGVEEAVPVKVVVNNCGTSLDVITFRGVPREDFLAFAGDRLRIIDGDLASWKARGDAALIGEVLARRRGLSVGEAFEAAGVKVEVAGIIASDEAMDRNVAYVQLEFLQQKARGGLGIVTQFNVKAQQGADLDAVAGAIDAEFANDQDPTHTRPEKAFVAQVANDLVELIGFTRWVGVGAVLAVLALVANTVLLAMRGRIRDNAIFQTVGFDGWALAWMVIVEGMVLGLLGGVVGVGLAYLALHHGGFSISSEGLSLVFDPTIGVITTAIAIAIALGLIAGLWPAWRAARTPIVASLRMDA